jgi:hypothetical protein
MVDQLQINLELLRTKGVDVGLDHQLVAVSAPL